MNESRYNMEVACEDTIPRNTMSIDCVFKKLP